MPAPVPPPAAPAGPSRALSRVGPAARAPWPGPRLWLAGWPLSRLLLAFGLAVLLPVGLLMAWVAGHEWQAARDRAVAAQALRACTATLRLAEMASRERGPTNGRLGDQSPGLPDPVKEVALQQARHRTDLATDDARQALAAWSGADADRTRTSLEQAVLALQAARHEVDRVAAHPPGERPAADIRAAVAGMIGVIPRLWPPLNQLAHDAAGADPTLSEPLTGARLAAELREVAGQLGSQFTPALANHQRFTELERRRILHLQGRIDQLHALLEVHLDALSPANGPLPASTSTTAPASGQAVPGWASAFSADGAGGVRDEGLGEGTLGGWLNQLSLAPPAAGPSGAPPASVGLRGGRVAPPLTPALTPALTPSLTSPLTPATASPGAAFPDSADPAESAQARLAAIARARADMNARWFGQALPLLDEILAIGSSDGQFTLDAAGFAARYVPQMEPFLVLRDRLLDEARARHAAGAVQARRTTLWLTVCALAIVATMAVGGWLLRRRVTRPLTATRELIVALAQGDLSRTVPPAAARDEIGDVLDALRVLKANSQERARLAQERDVLIEQLRAQSSTDFLTGLPNRRAFFETAERECANARRHRRPLSLLMFDLDHFKQVNDHHGHAMGDLCLQAVADAARQMQRHGDLVARIGGEEFAVLLCSCDGAAAASLAERLRLRLRSLGLRTPAGEPVALSTSLGVATLALPGESLDAALQRADAALYAAKNGGRDRVVVAPDPEASHGRTLTAPA